MKLSVYFKINAIDFLAEVLVMCVFGIKMTQIFKLKKKHFYCEVLSKILIPIKA